MTMIQYDLSDTRIAQARRGIVVPSEAELTVVTVALLVVMGYSMSDLSRQEIALSSDKLSDVAQFVEEQLSPLVRDFGGR